MSFPLPACAAGAGGAVPGEGGGRCPPWVPPVPLPLCGARNTSLRGGASGGQGRLGGVTTTGRSRAASEADEGCPGPLPLQPHRGGGEERRGSGDLPPVVAVFEVKTKFGAARLPPTPRRGARCGWEPAEPRLWATALPPHRRCYGPDTPGGAAGAEPRMRGSSSCPVRNTRARHPPRPIRAG